MMGGMRRRDKGSGWLGRRPRADGRWPASYVGSDGRRVYLYGRDRADARARLTQAVRDLEAGLHVTGPGQTLAQYLTDWLHHAEGRLAPRSVERYRGLVDRHVVPALGQRPVRKLTSQEIATLYADLRSTLAPASIAVLHAVLHQALDQAVRWRVIAANPAHGVKAPRPVRREMRFLDPEQARVLLEAAAGDPLAALYVAAVYTGLRLGELLALRWRDVDLEDQALTVRHTLTRIDGTLVLRQPKTAHSRRTVVMAPAAAEALRAHRLVEAERLLALGHRMEPETLVFSDRWGDPLHPGHITDRAFRPLLRRAGLPPIRFHDLRHTCASLLLSQGVRPEIVSRMLGHASPAMTLNVYAHLMPGDERVAVAQLQALIGGGHGR